MTRRRATAAGLVAFAAMTLAGAADAGTFTKRGTVVRVIDGDTLVAKLPSGKRERVRLIGIDTPELSPAECYGARAKSRARKLALWKRVVLKGDSTQATRDKYGRLLAYVWLPRGRDLGHRLVSGGFARVYVYDRPFKRVGVYRKAEDGASAADRGLWGACGTTGGSTAPPPPECDPSYPDFCIPPPPPDLDCADVSGSNFTVVGKDPHGFDGNDDGVGCES